MEDAYARSVNEVKYTDTWSSEPFAVLDLLRVIYSFLFQIIWAMQSSVDIRVEVCCFGNSFVS